MAILFFLLIILVIGVSVYETIKLNKASEEYSEDNHFIQHFHSLDEALQVKFLDSLSQDEQSMFQAMLNIELEDDEEQILIRKYNTWAENMYLPTFDEPQSTNDENC